MFVLSGEMKMLPLQDCAWGFGLYLSIISLVQWGHSNPRWRMVNRAPGIRPRHPYTYTECTVTHWGLVTQICIYEVTLHLCRKRRGASSAQSHYLNKCWHIASWAVRVISDSTLQWRHNDCDGVSNHLRFDCLFNRLFKRGSKKYYTPASLAFVIWIHRWPGWPVDSPHKGPVTRTMFPFDAVFMKYTHFCSIKYIWKNVTSKTWTRTIWLTWGVLVTIVLRSSTADTDTTVCLLCLIICLSSFQSDVYSQEKLRILLHLSLILCEGDEEETIHDWVYVMAWCRTGGKPIINQRWPDYRRIN